ncbi:MAG: T9SS type A sorting domain-containing protein [Cyclobacteriaceae bacterium]
MKFLLSVFLIFTIFISFSQQAVEIKIKPTHSRAIEGHKELDRLKYFNLAANVDELKKVLTDEQRTKYIEELEMTLGRKLGLVHAEKNWGNSIIEDPNRPGYIDVDYFLSKQNPSDAGLDPFMTAFGSSQGLALHDRHNAYPDFMSLYGKDGTSEQMPGNIDAAAELAALLLKHEFTDFQRPNYYEVVNEPNWRFNSDERFFDLHTAIKDRVNELSLSVEVGGPCSPVSNYFKNEYDNLSVITGFIDGTDAELDFYSFHSYDYMSWDGEDFVGSVNSGLPLEGVIDGVATFMHNKYNKPFKYVASEHGAYVTNTEEKEAAYEELATKYFPGSGFDYEMEKRNIDNFIMVNGAIANTLTYMNHPHIVQKSVPFILLESSGWDPKYYSCLLVKENFQKTSAKWRECRLIDFFDFFQDVQGRRVEFWSDDTDIQSFAFVDDNQLIVVLHNQSNVEAKVNLNIDDFDQTPTSIKVRKLYRKVDFRPEMTEEEFTTMPDLTLESQGSMVVFMDYANNIPEEEDYDEKIYYSDIWEQNFSGSRDFKIDISDFKQVRSATLRVGISREASKSREIEISLNGTKLKSPLEDCADRITADDYGTTRIIHVDPSLVKNENTISVNFPDGKTGGVGSAVMRVTFGEPVEFIEPEEVLDIDDSKSFNIYPNPANQVINIVSSEIGQIEIFDLSGQLQFTSELFVGRNVIDRGNLKSGVYIVKITDQSSHVITKRLIFEPR